MYIVLIALVVVGAVAKFATRRPSKIDFFDNARRRPKIDFFDNARRRPKSDFVDDAQRHPFDPSLGE